MTTEVEQPVQQQNQEQKDEVVEDVAPLPVQAEDRPASSSLITEETVVPQEAGGSGTESDSEESMPDLEDDAAQQSQSAVSWFALFEIIRWLIFF